MSELTSTGKSGSFFYYTVNGRFTLKTLHKKEFQFLKKILKNYHQHIYNHNNSLITKFYGMHKLKFLYKKGRHKNIYFVIMGNVFNTKKEIHKRYDLKGSMYKRYTKSDDITIALKEKNWIEDNNPI